MTIILFLLLLSFCCGLHSFAHLPPAVYECCQVCIFLNFVYQSFYHPQICQGKFEQEVSFLQLPPMLEKAIVANFAAHHQVHLARSPRSDIGAAMRFKGDDIVHIRTPMQGMNVVAREREIIPVLATESGGPCCKFCPGTI